MADGRGKAAWAQTSALLSLTYNLNRDPKKDRARYPNYFNPYAKDDGGRVVSDFGELKHFFVGVESGE